MTTRTRSERQVAGLTVTEWAGAGPAVVGLPGLGSSGRTFSSFADRLPDRHVVGLHLRGRGDSKDLAGPTGLRAHARDVAAVLEELDLTDVVVVGHSMGAYLAPLVAQEAAGRVGRLVLVDGGVPPKLPPLMGPRLVRFAFRRELRALDKDWPSLDAMAGRRIAPMLRERPDLRPLLLQTLADDCSPAFRPLLDVDRCVADAVDTFFGPDTTPALEALAVPAHLVAATDGKKDGAKPFLAAAVVQAWTSRLPLLTAERVRGNHATVLFSDEVLAVVAGPTTTA
ncbi:MAG: alpha/beta hydrolase [Frankiales bacterium]|nr:alpha/beta hydrolase [Frankiales bacterium]